MNTAKVFKYTGFGILGIGFMFLLFYVLMRLWNWLIPDLFQGPEIGYWQMVGLFFLAKILLAGFSPCGSHHDSKHSKKWKKKYAEKYAHKYHEHHGPQHNNEAQPASS